MGNLLDGGGSQINKNKIQNKNHRWTETRIKEGTKSGTKKNNVE